MTTLTRTLAVLACSVALSAPAIAAECEMELAFNQDDNRGNTSVAVWAGSDALFFGEGLHVNTDGTRRSYSVDDFWGQTSAINNLCNAMSDACDGLNSSQLRDRRIATQTAAANGWPAAELAATKISSSIIPFKNSKPCPAVDGFLVSATALADPDNSDVCDIDKYVDSLKVNAIVIPGSTNFSSRTKVGDLAVILGQDGETLVYGVVGDVGPRREIGEGSVALSRVLLGMDHDPAHYDEVRGRNGFQSWDVPFASVLIFTGTRDTGEPYMTADRIEPAAKDAFEAWGGKDRLAACVADY